MAHITAKQNRHSEKKSSHTQHVFIIGCKGIPAKYGGFETFVDKLTEYQTDKSICYHVACAAEREDYDRAQSRFRCHRAQCVVFAWRQIGPARAIAYDIEALCYFLRYAEKSGSSIRFFMYWLAGSARGSDGSDEGSTRWADGCL